MARHVYKQLGATQTTKYHFDLLQWRFVKTDQSAASFFHFNLWGVIDFTPLQGNHFDRTMGHPFNTNTSPTHYQKRYPRLFFSPFRKNTIKKKQKKQQKSNMVIPNNHNVWLPLRSLFSLNLWLKSWLLRTGWAHRMSCKVMKAAHSYQTSLLGSFGLCTWDHSVGLRWLQTGAQSIGTIQAIL